MTQASHKYVTKEHSSSANGTSTLKSGEAVLRGLLGHDAKGTAVFGAVAPLLGGAGGRWHRARAVLTPLLWLFAGMAVVSAAYGAFLIGRPVPLFRKLFRDAAEAHDPLYGAAAFVPQSVGNLAVLAVLLLLTTWLAGGRLRGWFAAKPARLTVVSAALLVTGVFTVLYWDVRLLAVREIIPWYPIAPRA